jgi:hypothetical protein
MRQVRMKLVGGVEGMERFPELLEHVGRYLVRYEPELAPQGKQWLWTTNDPEEALVLPFDEMHSLYSTSIGTRPWDGKPDRPLTAYHVEIL